MFKFSSPKIHGLQFLRRVRFQLSQNLEGCLLAGRQLQWVIYKFSKSFEACVRDVTKFKLIRKSQFCASFSSTTRFSTVARTPRFALLLAWCSSSAVFHVSFFFACLMFELEVFLLKKLLSLKITFIARIMGEKTKKTL